MIGKDKRQNRLDRVDEGFFDTVKDQNADQEDDKHKAGAVGEAAPGGIAGTQEAGTEGLDDGGDGVDIGDPAPFFGDAGDGVDDGGAVHPEADTEGDQVLEVAVLGGHGGDDDAEAKAEAGHEEDQEGKGQGPSRKRNGGTAQVEVEQEGEEEEELDAEGDEVGDDDGDGGDEAWEVDLAEEVGVADEGGGGVVEAAGEVAPEDGAGHVEEELREAVGGEFGDVAEDDGEYDGG